MVTAWPRRVLAHGIYETRCVMRNGEQLLLTVFLPILVLIVLTKTSFLSDDPGRIDAIAPSILALVVISVAFTSQAIATGFDRRAGALRLFATTPLGPDGLIAGKVVAVILSSIFVSALIIAAALILSWHPEPVGFLLTAAPAALGIWAFVALALLLAGTVRAEAVLAIANLAWILLLATVIAPTNDIHGPLAVLIAASPSGALATAFRAAFDGTFALGPLGVLACWAIAATAGTMAWFKWN